MKTLLRSLLFLVIGLVLTTCQKKKFDFEFVDSKCKNFKIDYARVQNISDPSCTFDNPPQTTGQLVVTFDYKGDKDCIKSLAIEALFYNNSSNTISGVGYETSLPSSALTITENTVQFTFRYTFASTADADNMNYLVIKMATVNEVEKKSNTILARYNSSCFVPDPSTYTNEGSIDVDVFTQTLYLYDSAADDGDIISVYVNNTLVVDRYRLTKDQGAFNISVSSGDRIVFYAMNQGSSGPNTLGFILNGTTKEVNLETNQGFAYSLF
ncbi:MAG: hypothetical protein MUF42_11395 [Cytophagaceae bacterium]|jgi:hypothetical protein|nr:hypothetical protein [Cytophagaceae bacterium]